MTAQTASVEFLERVYARITKFHTVVGCCRAQIRTLATLGHRLNDLSKIRRGQIVLALVGQNADLERDAFFHWKPVELTQCRRDVVKLFNSSCEPSCSVLNTLKLLQ